jgi:hypothetical protein
MESATGIFQIMYGVSSFRALGDRFLEGLSIARELANYAEKADDLAGCAVAYRWYGALLSFQPQHEQSLVFCQKAIDACRNLDSRKITSDYGHDPKSLALAYSAHVIYTVVSLTRPNY